MSERQEFFNKNGYWIEKKVFSSNQMSELFILFYDLSYSMLKRVGLPLDQFPVTSKVSYPNDMKTLVQESVSTWQALGKVSYGATDSEKDGLKFRRSIYIVEDMEAEEIITNKNLRIIRPGRGLAPKYYEKLLGRKVNQKLKRGTALAWNMIEEN